MLQQSSSAVSGFKDPGMTDAKDDEEHFYCSAIQNVENIICAGSDTEESPEETVAKRYRYEEAARRYAQGLLPLLQSASLRGPLDDGWINPWRYRPHTKPKLWKSGAVDMLHNRPEILKPAVEHGQEDQKLREISALGKVQVTDGKGASREQPPKARSSLDEARSHKTAYSRHTLPTELHHWTPQAQKSRGDDEIGMFRGRNTSNQVDIKGPSSSTSTGHNSTKAKRAADAEWLKGSYISKQARWESAAVSTPTPMPDPTSMPKPRRKPRAKLLPSKEVSQSSPRALFGSTPQTIERRPSTTGKNSRFSILSRPEDERIRVSNSGESRVEDRARLNCGANESEIGTFTSLTRSKVRYSSSSSLSSKRKAGDPIISSRRAGVNEKHRATPIDNRVDYQPESFEDLSFITEVAPSCGDLEKFQYRKRRKLDSVSPHDCNNSPSQASLLSPQPVATEYVDDHKTYVESSNTHPGDDFMRASTQRQILSVTPPHQVEISPPKASHLEQSFAENSDSVAAPVSLSMNVSPHATDFVEEKLSDDSWDLVEDVSKIKASLRAGGGKVEDDISRISPLADIGNHDNHRHKPQTTTPRRTGSPAKSQGPTSMKSSCVQQLLARDEHVPFGDSSTQSYNSTPLEARSSFDMQEQIQFNDVDISTEGQGVIALTDEDSSTPQAQQTFEDRPTPSSHQIQRALDDHLHQENTLTRSIQPRPNQRQDAEQGDQVYNASPVTLTQKAQFVEFTSTQAQSPSSRGSRLSMIGPQSPWHHEENGLIATVAWRKSSIGSRPAADDSEGKVDDWEKMDRPTTPDNDIKPFSDFMSPTPSPAKAELVAVRAKLPSTQQVLEAAVTNPWNSSLKKPGSGKSQKRVSFGDLPSTTEHGSSPLRISSPPPPSTSELIASLPGQQLPNHPPSAKQFEMHFAAAAKSKPMLPGGLSQGSPGIIAMAERFIAADENAVKSQKRHRVSPSSPPRPLLTSSPSKVNTGTREGNIADKSEVNHEAEGPRLGAVDGEENIGSIVNELGNFLQEWSVDAELKKLNTSCTSKPSEAPSYSARRRFTDFNNPW